MVARQIKNEERHPGESPSEGVAKCHVYNRSLLLRFCSVEFGFGQSLLFSIPRNEARNRLSHRPAEILFILSSIAIGDIIPFASISVLMTTLLRCPKRVEIQGASTIPFNVLLNLDQ